MIGQFHEPLVKPVTIVRKEESTAELKRQSALVGLVSSVQLEDPAKWEQINQAGCVFWRNVESREIKTEKPRMRGQPREKRDPGRYALGTGSVLYDEAAYDELRGWMVAQGATPPELPRPATPKQVFVAASSARRTPYLTYANETLSDLNDSPMCQSS